MKRPFAFLAVTVATLSACGQQPTDLIDASRIDNGSLVFYASEAVGGSVVDQVTALQDMAQDVVRTSTIRGAAIGAAAGCGLALVSASEAQRCLAGAVIGGAGGAALGHMAGERSVDRRLDLVAEAEAARSLQNAQTQIAQIREDLPAILARQEAELNRLTMAYARGDMTLAEHDLALAKVTQERADLAEALTLSGRDLRTAHRNLQQASQRGQSGLEWHMTTASRLSEDVQSMRASFDTW